MPMVINEIVHIMKSAVIVIRYQRLTGLGCPKIPAKSVVIIKKLVSNYTNSVALITAHATGSWLIIKLNGEIFSGTSVPPDWPMTR